MYAIVRKVKKPKKIIISELNKVRREFVKKHYPDVIVVDPKNCIDTVKKESEHNGAGVVIEAAGSEESFKTAWQAARANAVVVIAALYNKSMNLPLNEMYGKNLTFKTGGVDGCDCSEILSLIEQKKIDTTPLVTHKFKLKDIEKAYEIFENKSDNVIKVAIENQINRITY